ncbi:MAG: FecR domain-containing protein [Prevotella sp.]|jgi:transmembrane sensor|nr:FecR domain-containing protein [Prevotella sp.]MCI1281924.1 FecR domain-containing protein [Prevotella sp.]
MDKTTNHTTKNEELVDRLLDDLKLSPISTERVKKLTFQKIHLRQRRARMVRTVAIALAAACVLAFVFVIPRIRDKTGEIASNVIEKDVQMDTLRVSVGEQRTVILADGTRLTANSRSEVIYPRSFDGKNRVIQAKGEVFCEVTHDACHPFIVKSGDFVVRVLGTKFNICNYGCKAKVVLVQGCVELSTKNERLRMKPSDLVDLTDGNITSKKKVNTADFTSWMNGIINLNGDNIYELTGRLTDYYGVHITCECGSGCRLYGKLVFQKDVTTMLNAISGIAGVKVYRRGNEYVLHH